MTTLYIARHCETVWNAEKRMQGWNDSAPSAEGIIQTEALAKRMSIVEINRFYSSPTGRAYFTAQQVQKNHFASIVSDNRLREIHLGTWEGRLESELKKEYADQYFNFWKNPSQYKSNNGEEFADVAVRMKSFLDEISEKDNGLIVFAVSHTVAIRMLCSVIMGFPVADLWKGPELKPTAVTEIRILSGKAEVVRWGDSSHLL